MSNTPKTPGFDEALKLMVSIFGDAFAEIAAKQEGPGVADMTKKASNDQQAKLENYDKMAADLALAQTTIDIQRERIQELLDTKQAAELRADALNRQVSAIYPRQLRVQDSYNKLWKDYTACKNQRDSYAKTIAEQKDTIKELREQIESLKAAPAQVPVIIIDGVSYDEEKIHDLQKQAAKPRVIMVDGQAYGPERIRQLNAAHQSEEYWRKMVADIETSKRTLEGRIISLESEVKHERHLRSQFHSETVRLGRELANLKHNMADNRSVDINKMRKDLTAERNRTRSYEATITDLRFQIKDLEAKLEEAKQAPVTPVNAITVNGVTYSADDIQRVVNTSIERAETISQLCVQRDDAIKKAQNLAAQVHVYSYRGHDLTPDEIKEYLDLGIAAKNTGLTVDRINAAVETEPTNLSMATTDRRPQTVVVEDPDHDFVRLNYPGRTLEVAANLIPQMVADVNSLRTEVNNSKEREENLTKRNKDQAESLCAAEARIDQLRIQIDELTKKGAEQAKTIQQLTIERNLLRGRANAEKPNKVNGQTLEAGQTYMTTALGMLPVDANGMRQLSDALDSYRARVQALTSGLREWIKE